VKDLGFLCKKRKNPRPVLTEKHDIRCTPVTHLTALTHYTEEGSAAVYGMIQQQPYWTREAE
jgi:hypothetical protein